MVDSTSSSKEKVLGREPLSLHVLLSCVGRAAAVQEKMVELAEAATVVEGRTRRLGDGSRIGRAAGRARGKMEVAIVIGGRRRRWTTKRVAERTSVEEA